MLEKLTMNELRKFDQNQIDLLQEYVYVLRDPRDRKVFYVGKGTGNRLFSHFDEADDLLKVSSISISSLEWKSKLIRIIDIWNSGSDVEWFIVRYGMKPSPDNQDETSDLNAFDVEAALIDVLEISQNGPALNDYKGHRSKARGLLSIEDIGALAASLVNSENAYQTVFVFPIHKALERQKNIYDATRCCWGVLQALRQLQPALAVGVSRGISRGVYVVNSWSNAGLAPNKWQFTSNNPEQPPNHELNNKSWLTILNHAYAYWGYGNYLVVEFDGKGNFKFLHGSSDKTTWFML